MRELFDDIIKKKLENFENRPKGIAWEDFKAHMDSELGPETGERIDEQLDQNVKSKINDYTVAYKSSHWAVLKSKLKTQARNLENLYVSKTFEFITFILLLMTFLQSGFYLPSKSVLKNTEVAIYQKQEINPNSSVLSNPSNSIPTQSKKLDDNQLANHSIPIIQEISKPGLINNGAQDLSKENIQIAASDISPVSTERITLITNAEVEDALTSNFFHKQLSDLDRMSGLTLTAFEVSYDRPFVQAGIAAKKLTQETSDRYLSMFINADNNLINTPADQVYKNIDAVLFNSFGYGAGLSYDMALSNLFEFGAGLSYSTLSYQPQQIHEVFLDQETGGTYSIFLENIFFSVVKVPLNLRLKFGDQSKWSFFTEFGLSTNVIAESDYSTISRALRIPVAGVAPAEFNAHATNNETGPRLFQKSFTDGLFQGGSFADNLYFTANLGFGFRKAISNHTALFGSLKYRNHIFDNGVGPNEDKLHAISFTLGAQYSLN